MTLAEQAQEFVFSLFKDKLSDSFTYHNFEHTKRVVAAADEILGHQAIADADKEVLLVAAWFHDTGYLHGVADHESFSIEIATGFLQAKEYNPEFISKVAQLINATRYGHIPNDNLEQIIRDADYAHFSSPDYLHICELLRTEWQKTLNKSYTDLSWAEENLKVLTAQQFYTDYAIRNWQPLKEKNCKKLNKRIKKIKEGAMENDQLTKKKVKEDKMERGVETMFRTTLGNHTRLSEIADSKANILLSVNAIIISIALSTIIPKLDSPGNVHLIVPTFTMLLFSVICIIFAILSTRPKVTSGTFSKEDIKSRKVNLLFFGNFYKMPFEEYQSAMNEMMNDKEYLYNSMIKDLYYLGLVLEKKYRLLRITYNIFMVGIIITAIVFVVAFKHVAI